MTSPGPTKVALVTDLEDSAWDSFLEGTPLGHFQQSSLWAKAKEVDGWRPIRRVVTIDGRMVGGFQILVRHTRLGNIGYIYKGPVIVSEESDLPNLLIELVISTTKANHLRALIVQPPDESTMEAALWTKHGSLPNRLVAVINATLLVDLSGGLEQVLRGMRRSTRAEIRQASERGVSVRSGGEKDIEQFFSLMAETCRRQHATPAPASAGALTAVWQAFSPQNKVKLFLAEYQGEVVAGLLCLCFGHKVVAWKRGWSGQHGERNPNQLTTFEAIKWACENNYQRFDFDALDRKIAVAILKGTPLSEEQKRSRDYVNLAFGRRPLLLPESTVYIPHPLVRMLYHGGIGATAWLKTVHGT